MNDESTKQDSRKKDGTKKESDDLREGDRVEWSSHGGDAVGEVEEEITNRTNAAGRTVAASKDDPQFMVRSDKSGGETVHKPGAPRKRDDD